MKKRSVENILNDMKENHKKKPFQKEIEDLSEIINEKTITPDRKINMTLEECYAELEKNRKPETTDPYDVGRITHCYLVYKNKGVEHCFEVRGWQPVDNNILRVSVVNWTACAGSAMIELTPETIQYYNIV